MIRVEAALSVSQGLARSPLWLEYRVIERIDTFKILIEREEMATTIENRSGDPDIVYRNGRPGTSEPGEDLTVATRNGLCHRQNGDKRFLEKSTE